MKNNPLIWGAFITATVGPEEKKESFRVKRPLAIITGGNALFREPRKVGPLPGLGKDNWRLKKRLTNSRHSRGRSIPFEKNLVGPDRGGVKEKEECRELIEKRQKLFERGGGVPNSCLSMLEGRIK